MKRRSKHDEIEAPLPGVPALEHGDLDGDALLLSDYCHSRIRLNRKNINPFPEQLFGSDPRTRANIEHRLRALRQEVIDQLVGVARPTRIVDARRGTE